MATGNDKAAEVGARLRHLREELGFTQGQLADRISSYLRNIPQLADFAVVTGELVRKWESGHVKLYRHVERLDAAAAILGVSTDEILTGERKAEYVEKRMRRIPVLGDLAAGPGDGATGVVEWIDVEDWENVYERWGRRVRGDSMHPALLHGDLCIFESRVPETGEIVHAEHEPLRVDTIKTYRRSGGKPQLTPENPESDAIDGDGWTLKGPLVEVRRNMGGIQVIIRNPNGMPLRPEDLTPLLSAKNQ